MLEELLPYFERELANLRELGGEFARRYPKLAGRLQLSEDRCEDPHVERLVEAFAFLGARIHRKLDDEYPEIAASFLEVMYPHYLRPIPSMTIVQFGTDARRPEIAKRYTVPRHQIVNAPPVGGTVCRFRTCYPVDLYPLAVVQARLELTSGSAYLRRLAPEAAAVLTLELETPGGIGVAGIRVDALRFFLDGETALTHLLHELLLSRTKWVRVGDGRDDPARTRDFPASVVAPVGFGRDDGMIDYDERSFLGYRFLTEYFAFPEKFLFVDLQRIGEAASALSGNKLVIQCIIDRYPDTERHQRLLNSLAPEHFKLGCTPIVNLFEQAGDPIHLTHRRASYPVWVDARRPSAYEVVKVGRVTRVEIAAAGEKNAEVQPFYALRHSGETGEANRFYWHSTREASPRPDDKGTDVELHLVDLDFTPARPGVEVLSLELLCSNRDLPSHIPFGGGSRSDFTLPGHSVVKSVRLLRKPTPSLRPPKRRGLQWRLVSHLSLNYLSLVEGGRDALQEMLTLYNFTDSQATRRQIEGIVTIESHAAVTRVTNPDFNGFVRGTDVTLTLDEDCYVGGSVYLFASVLERFLALYCAPNSFIRFTVRTHQQWNEEALAWPARSGEALVI
ncbi:MAG: type VI secretion system baseplate subunit TssF [Azoarcus sp.]|jgi:type VI secretion system protein ImpG|nr:type VI secretion system baseplate subunit TssF [Azoarcus sp.]